MAQRSGRTISVYPCPAPPASSLAVLIVDGEESECSSLRTTVEAVGCTAACATTGAAGIGAARAARFDLLLVAARLPDMNGAAVARMISCPAGWVLVGRHVTVRTAVDAMKLGAIDVLEKPLDQIHLRSILESARAESRTSISKELPPHISGTLVPRPVKAGPRSAGERWAMQVLRACESDGDLKTIRHWATFVGVSYSTLCETCRLVGIRPHDARDFARMLRAVMRSHDAADPSLLLDVADQRTLRVLLQRSGALGMGPLTTMSIERFLDGQHFVTLDNGALRILRQLLVPAR